MEELKNKGLNQETYQTVKTTLEKLPKRSALRIELYEWLKKHMFIQCRLKMGQTPLVVSSDCIETLMGSIKNIIERNPLPEFGRMVLATPLLCGKQSEARIEEAINKISHKDLQEWQSQHTNDSLRKQKQKLLSKTFKRTVPDPPIAEAA